MDTMRIRLFAYYGLREILGESGLTVALPNECDIAGLISKLFALHHDRLYPFIRDMAETGPDGYTILIRRNGQEVHKEFLSFSQILGFSDRSISDEGFRLAEADDVYMLDLLTGG